MTAEEGSPAVPGWRSSFRIALGVWVVAQAAHWIVTVLANLGHGNGLQGGLLHAWDQWDTVWFVKIAEHGYAAAGPYAPAFFPLYPMLMAVLPGHAFVAGLVEANVAFYAALVLLHRFAVTETEDGTASRALWYLIGFPTGFFLAAAYNTALFLALTVGAAYALRRQHWLLAGLLAALAGATRSSGLLLLVPLAYEYVRRFGWRPRRELLGLALVPLGLLGYVVYSWRALGDPWAFGHAQRHWSRYLDWPWSALGRQVGSIVRQPHLFNDTGLHNVIDLVAVLLAATLTVLCFTGPWKLRRDQYAFGLYAAALVLLMILFPTKGPDKPYPLQSSARFFLEVFPAFLIMARIGARTLADRAYLVIAVAAQAVLLAAFLHGAWVA